MTLDEFSDRLFTGVAEAARILEVDERTVRRAIAAGEIPATKVGARHMIPVVWLREQAGLSPTQPTTPPRLLPEAIADAIADRILTQFAHAIASLRHAGDRDGAA